MCKAVQIAALTFMLAACAAAPDLRPASHGTADTARIVGGAEAMLGQPYRYGGASPGGFDCSGLVVYAVGGAGIRLPRTAQQQLQSGTPVARRALRAGDLVFMHLARKDLHVGIAIDHDRFVHAPAAGGYVRIDSLAAQPYAHAFLTGRRIVDDPAERDRRSAAAGALQ